VVRSGSTKPVDDTHWHGRLRKARKYLEIATNELALAKPGDDAGPIMSNIILAVVAYADTLTAAISGVVNQGDHQMVVKALRGAMGKALPVAMENRLKAMLQKKDQVQYGASFEPALDAEKMLEYAKAFAALAEGELERRFPPRGDGRRSGEL
jgi:hypothetical protein